MRPTAATTGVDELLVERHVLGADDRVEDPVGDRDGQGGAVGQELTELAALGTAAFVGDVPLVRLRVRAGARAASRGTAGRAASPVAPRDAVLQSVVYEDDCQRSEDDDQANECCAVGVLRTYAWQPAFCLAACASPAQPQSLWRTSDRGAPEEEQHGACN